MQNAEDTKLSKFGENNNLFNEGMLVSGKIIKIFMLGYHEIISWHITL